MRHRWIVIISLAASLVAALGIACLVLGLTEAIKMVPGVAGVLVAIWALSKWRRELEGKAEFDLARRTLLAVYKMRGAISHVRNITGSTNQIARFEALIPANAELNVCLLEAEVLWGKLLDESKERLWDVQMAVVRAVRRRKRADSSKECGERMAATGRSGEIEAVAFGDEDDETGRKVTAAVRLFEEALRAHLPKR